MACGCILRLKSGCCLVLVCVAVTVPAAVPVRTAGCCIDTYWAHKVLAAYLSSRRELDAKLSPLLT